MAEAAEEAEGEDVAAGPDTSAAALALGLRRPRSRKPAGEDERLAAFLEKQGRLIDIQTEHLHEQRELQLHHLRVRRWKDRLTIATQAATLMAGLAVLAVLGVLAWQAHEDQSMVFEAFSTPPGLAQRGLTGAALAGELMDKVAAVKAEADRNSISRSADVKTERTPEVKVEIPETGLSVTGAWRLLHDWLAHEKKVGGELRETPDGQLVLIARVEGEPAIIVSGPASDLDRLEQKVAERIYDTGEQAGNYVLYLALHGRLLEALDEARALARTDPRSIGLLATLEQNTDPEQALVHARIAERADPLSPYPYFERVRAEINFGHTEAALEAAVRLREIMARSGSESLSGSGGETLRIFADSTIALLHGDYVHDPRHEIFQSMRSVTDAAALHDLAQARQTMADFAALHPMDGPTPVRARWRIDEAAGDWRAALKDGAALKVLDDQRLATPPLAEGEAGLARMIGANDTPLLALAEAMTGDLTGAQAQIRDTPQDAYTAVRIRGDIASLGRDWSAADHWFDLAVRLGPSSPFAYLDWARSLMARGALDAALQKLVFAEAKGPTFADPEELWGEALLARRDYEGASARFAAAAATAPSWGRDHMLWGEALWRTGRVAEARAQLEAASRLVLSDQERNEVNTWLARAASERPAG